MRATHSSNNHPIMTLPYREKSRLRTTYGNWAVVTGASSGIGLELATLLADAGFNLVLNSRREDILNELGHRLTSQFGIETIPVAADMSDAAGIVTLLQATDDLNIGLFIASAGYGTSGTFIDSELDSELDMLSVNCGALLTLTHHFSRRFAKQKRGGIILLSSMVAFQGTPFSANYAATKAYVQSLAEGIAIELKSHNVDVLAAAPGPVSSGFSQRANMTMSMSLKPSDVGVPILKALGRQSSVLPGFLTKFLVYSLRTVPRWAKVRIMGKVMGGMAGQF
jgi:short-subunit dehydrogenase